MFGAGGDDPIRGVPRHQMMRIDRGNDPQGVRGLFASSL
jgi:hypothetical protein